MDSYIEVVGFAPLIEQVTEYRADLSLSVRAAQAESALAEAGELRDQCIRTLKEAGLSSEELSEGGSTTWRPWFWKKKPGQETAYKILVSCAEAKRLYVALDALQPVFENQRYTLSVSMLEPRFSASNEGKAAAQRAAIADARRKADTIAGEANIALASIVQVEELSVATGRSGAYGDETWLGAPVAGGAASFSENDAGFQELDSAKRTSSVRYRVRFAIAEA
jgi:hypothetical protein